MSKLNFDLFNFSFQFIYMRLRLFDLRDDGVVAFVLLLEIPLKLALFCFPFLLHILFDLYLYFVKRFLADLLHYFFTVCTVLLYGSLFRLKLQIFILVLLSEALFELSLRLLLLFLKALSLLSQCFSNRLFHLPFTVLNFLLLLSLCLFFGVI